MRKILGWMLIATVVAFVAGGIVGNLTATSQNKEIDREIQEVKDELRARGEFIARLQVEVEHANAKATWLLRKIDKRRVLIPVMNGDVYKLVEIEASPEE